MERWQVVNHLIRRRGYQSYLEIGTCGGDAFYRVEAAYKVGVDARLSIDVEKPHRFFLQTSNEFFHKNQELFDIVFIDGLHTKKQALEDFQNALRILKPNGVVVAHDCNPTTKEMQLVPRESVCWTGDVWRAFATIRKNPEVATFVIDTDFGVGVIDPSRSNEVPLRMRADPMVDWQVPYEEFDVKRGPILNLITPSEFLSQYISA